MGNVKLRMRVKGQDLDIASCSFEQAVEIVQADRGSWGHRMEHVIIHTTTAFWAFVEEQQISQDQAKWLRSLLTGYVSEITREKHPMDLPDLLDLPVLPEIWASPGEIQALRRANLFFGLDSEDHDSKAPQYAQDTLSADGEDVAFLPEGTPQEPVLSAKEQDEEDARKRQLHKELLDEQLTDAKVFDRKVLSDPEPVAV